MPTSATQPSDGGLLDLPRRIEQTLGNAQDLRSRLKKGPFRRRRVRVRRQLQRMIELLGEVQRWSIAQPPSRVDTHTLRALVDALDALLHEARHAQLTKPGLRRLRHTLKQQRHDVRDEWSALGSPVAVEPAVLASFLVHEQSASD